jgi:hypothetical protein
MESLAAVWSLGVKKRYALEIGPLLDLVSIIKVAWLHISLSYE